MAIPAILKGDTSGSIVLDIMAGYEYEGCTLTVEFNGVKRQFTNLVAGGTKSLQYTAAETAGMPLGTGHATLTLTNSAGVVRSMPWVRIRVTDIPSEIYDRHITVDPSQLDVPDATAGDSLGAVKAKLNAIMAYLRGGAGCIVACLGLSAFGDLCPTNTLNDVPGDTTISNLVAASGITPGGGGGITPAQAGTIATNTVDAKVAAWAMAGQPQPTTDLGPAFAYTTAVSNKLETGKADASAVYTKTAADGRYLQTSYDWELQPSPLLSWYNNNLNLNGLMTINMGLSVYAPVNATAFATGGSDWSGYTYDGSSSHNLQAALDAKAPAAALASVVTTNDSGIISGSIGIGSNISLNAEMGGSSSFYGFLYAPCFIPNGNYDWNSYENGNGGKLGDALDAKIGAVASTNIAVGVFGECADYMLTNLTETTFTLSSGTIGNITLTAAQNALNVTLAYPAVGRAGDIMLRVVAAADTALNIDNASTDVDGSEWTTIKAGTNTVCITRVAHVAGRSVVQAFVKEVK